MENISCKVGVGGGGLGDDEKYQLQGEVGGGGGDWGTMKNVSCKAGVGGVGGRGGMI